LTGKLESLCSDCHGQRHGRAPKVAIGPGRLAALGELGALRRRRGPVHLPTDALGHFSLAQYRS
jgi:hypothetical protein